METNVPWYSRGRSMPVMNLRTDGTRQLLVPLEELLPADPVLLPDRVGCRPRGRHPDSAVVHDDGPALAGQVAQHVRGCVRLAWPV